MKRNPILFHRAKHSSLCWDKRPITGSTEMWWVVLRPLHYSPDCFLMVTRLPNLCKPISLLSASSAHFIY